MFRKVFQATALAAAVGLAVVPALAQAASYRTTFVTQQPRHVSYNTTLEPITGFAVPWTGTLQLTINPDGIVQGYYRPYNEQFIPVTGGLTGKNIWLDIGRTGAFHINGTLQNGKIVGAAVDQHTLQQYRFDAKAAS